MWDAMVQPATALLNSDLPFDRKGLREILFKNRLIVILMFFRLRRQKVLNHRILTPDKFYDDFRAELSQPSHEFGDRNVSRNAHMMDQRQTHDHVRNAALRPSFPFASPPSLRGRRIDDIHDERQDAPGILRL